MLTLTFVGASLAAAQSGEEAVPQSTSNPYLESPGEVVGVLLTSTETSMTIRREDGTTMTFAYDANASFPAELKSGDRIRVAYTSSPDAGNVVSTVIMMPAASASAEPTSAAEELPATASPLLLLGLTGLVALGGGIMLMRRGVLSRDWPKRERPPLDLPPVPTPPEQQLGHPSRR
jgi:hypothetical protein